MSESRFWWHWQDLKDDGPKRIGIHGRAWLHRRPRGVFGVEWHLPALDFHIDVTVGGGERQLCWSVGCGLFALYFHLDGWRWLDRWHVMESYQGKVLQLAFHSWALWWNIWTDEHEWSSKTPKWRDGCFHLDDFFLGKAGYSKVDWGTEAISISLPEGDYPATVTFFSQIWKRSRWPIPKRRDGAEIKIESGIPIPGKGESAWDCGDVVDTVTERRARYGGKDWKPQGVRR